MADEKTPGDEAQTFEQKVNSIVDQFQVGEDGKASLPEDVAQDLDQATLYAVTAEKRRRDTQAAFTRNQQELKRSNAENERLRNRWKADAVKNLSDEQREELDDLKHSDPDAWRAKLNEIEQNASTAFDEQLQTISDEVHNETELERRARVLDEFQSSNPGIVLNDEVIENDIPPRFTKQLENGEVSFEEFLDKCKKFLSEGRVLETPPKGEEQPTLHDLGGGSAPREEDVAAAAKSSYKNEVF